MTNWAGVTWSKVGLGNQSAAKSVAEAIAGHFSFESFGCERFGIRVASPGQSPLCRLDVLRDGLDAVGTSRG